MCVCVCVCVCALGGRLGLSREASPFRNSTEESSPWPVHVAATNYRDCECVCVCVCAWVLKGRSRHKMEGTSPNHRTLAPHKGKKAAPDHLNLNSISPPALFFRISLPLSPPRDKSRAKQR